MDAAAVVEVFDPGGDPGVDLVALNMAIYQRRRDGIDARGVVHHSDRGVQYRDVRYGQALARCQAVVGGFDRFLQ